MPNHNMEIEIDPVNLNETTTRLLALLLKAPRNNDDTIFKSVDHTYNVNIINPVTRKEEIQPVYLNKHIIKRGRKDNKEGVRYEVVDKSQKLGDGAEGTVYKSLGVLIEKNGSVIFKFKPRAVKRTRDIDRANNEYRHALRAPHLHIKPIVLQKRKHLRHGKTMFSSYMTMRLCKGVELQSIINRELDGKKVLSPDQRLALSIRILQAVQSQVHQHDLVHRDLKAENIIVDPDSMDISIIDYSYSKDLRDPKDKPLLYGTPVLMPPEQWRLNPDDPEGYTIKADCYALGRTLAELWNAELLLTNPLITTRHFGDSVTQLREIAKYDCNYDYQAAYFDGLSDPHIDQIKNLFEQLTRAKPGQRLPLDQAVSCLENIVAERKLEPVLKQARLDNHG